MNLHTYLPQDRLHALVRGESLPERTTGAALFADISGFTALTESLAHQFGARRGMDDLTRQINAVYDALILEIERFGGSVISFAGDAITCWFDDSPAKMERQPAIANRPAATVYATTAALAMQAAMQKFPHLGLKVAVATGPARRFLVGDPCIHYLDALAGETVTRTSTGEHLSQRGEVLVDEYSAKTLGSALVIQEWREAEDGKRFGVVGDLRFTTDDLRVAATKAQIEISKSEVENLTPESLRPFILPAVYESEISGQGSFLTELRPCVVLFVRFTGLDYAAEDAQTRLDISIRQMQAIIARHDGALLQLAIGDKGSYVYISFGSLAAHEDDARRAVKTALELCAASVLQLQIGVTQGVMRVGAYGGSTRCTYGAIGDDVNLSARLMMAAAPGEILVSGVLQKAVEQRFTFEPRPPLLLKGKAEPLPTFAVTGERQQRAIRLQEPAYALPMVGRQRELQVANDKLELALTGQAQVLGITAEAGLGKSRLVAEVIRLARKKGFTGYGGSCQSDGIHTPYLAWKSIWSAFFDVDPSAPLRKQIRNLEGEIEDRAPTRVEALPLLGTLLDLNIPDNDFTSSLEPKIRQSALHALLEDCLKAATQDGPLLIVIEDAHWIDALSHDLLDQLAKALTHSPICFVLAYRPAQLAPSVVLRLETLQSFTKIELAELNAAESEQAIRAKLAQLYPARSGAAVPSVLVEKLMVRAQGNPFYLEELLNYLHDRELDPRDPADLEKIELPDSLHTLILSRIDQLSENERTTLRVASIVGRLFRAAWLTGYYPELGELPRVKVDLDKLRVIDITPLDSPEPELAYLFKHIVLHEVTYESLPFATRARLHEQLAQYLEATFSDTPPLESLAFHYGRSENTEKQREYLCRAGESAQKTFANEAALAYYGQLLPLLSIPTEKIEIYLQRGAVLQLLGRWDEAEIDYRAALDLAQNHKEVTQAQFSLGKLCRQRGNFDAALGWLAQAKTERAVLEDRTGLGQVLIETGMVFYRKGEYAQARTTLNEGLALARAQGNKANVALALNNLGNVADSQGDTPGARALHEESLALRRELGDKAGIHASLNNLGLVAENQGDHYTAKILFEESLALCREMGDKWGVAALLNNLGLVAEGQSDYSEARKLYEECLSLCREMGDQWSIAVALNNLGNMTLALGNHLAAKAMQEECLALCRVIGEKSTMAYAFLGLGLAILTAAQDASVPEARQYIAESLKLRQEIGEQAELPSTLAGMAGVCLHSGDASRAAQLLGAVDSALKTLNATLTIEKRFHAQTLSTARTVLGDERFQSAWASGEKLSLDDAVRMALDG